MKLIDDPLDLVKLSKEELDEVLLEDKYNKPLLRELVRLCIGIIKAQSSTLRYHMKKSEEATTKLEKVLIMLQE